MDNIYGPSDKLEQREVYAPVNEKTNFNEKVYENRMPSKQICRMSLYYNMYYVFHVIVGLFALYLSFRCNRGINVLDLLFALFCPVLYIIYRTAVCNELIRAPRV